MKQFWHMENDMEEREKLINHLQWILSTGCFGPKFNENPKFEGEDPFVAYEDLMANRWIIREGDQQTNSTWYANKANRVIVTYQSIEEMVDDGWTLLSQEMPDEATLVEQWGEWARSSEASLKAKGEVTLQFQKEIVFQTRFGLKVPFCLV